MGHASESIVKKTSMAHMQVKLSGELQPCEGCLLEKAQRKSVPKVSMKKAMQQSERLLLDTTGPFAPSLLRGTIYDVYIGCQLTSMLSWVFHVKKKTEVPQCLENVLTWSQCKGYKVQFLRCDNAGEHQARLIDVCPRFGVHIEYTAPNTPRQNGQIEMMFAVDRGRLYSMNQEQKLWIFHLSRSYRPSANWSSYKVTSANIQRLLIGAGRKCQFIRRLGLKNADPGEVFGTVAAFLNASREHS